MVLEKIRKLRRMEYTFTDGEVHPNCHMVYEEIIEEDGVEITKTISREVEDAVTQRTDLAARKVYVHPDNDSP